MKNSFLFSFPWILKHKIDTGGNVGKDKTRGKVGKWKSDDKDNNKKFPFFVWLYVKAWEWMLNKFKKIENLKYDWLNASS